MVCVDGLEDVFEVFVVAREEEVVCELLELGDLLVDEVLGVVGVVVFCEFAEFVIVVHFVLLGRGGFCRVWVG